MIRPEIMALLPRCCVTPWLVSGTTVSPSVQKVILWTLAAFEGAPISQRAIASYSGVVDQTVVRALMALQQQGFVVQRLAPGGTAATYDLDAERLAKNQVEEEPVRSRG